MGYPSLISPNHTAPTPAPAKNLPSRYPIISPDSYIHCTSPRPSSTRRHGTFKFLPPASNSSRALSESQAHRQPTPWRDPCPAQEAPRAHSGGAQVLDSAAGGELRGITGGGWGSRFPDSRNSSFPGTRPGVFARWPERIGCVPGAASQGCEIQVLFRKLDFWFPRLEGSLWKLISWCTGPNQHLLTFSICLP